MEWMPGGVRVWWRALFGSEDDLDTAHLMRMAGRFARRIRAFAKANAIPVVDCAPKEKKFEIAQTYLAAHSSSELPPPKPSGNDQRRWAGGEPFPRPFSI